LRKIVKEATGQMPFRLVYGSEALLPVEIGTTRLKHLSPKENQESRLLDLELNNEVRENAALKMAAYQNRIARFYNRKVKHRSFQVGDLVLINARATQKHEHDKLSEKSEGAYIISEDCGNGTYKLKTANGEQIRDK
jgi:hypothetical protein